MIAMNNPKAFRDFITPENVSHVRLVSGLRQEDAAGIVDRQVQAWCLWESGRNRMPYSAFECFVAHTALNKEGTEIVWGKTGEILGILSHETLCSALPYEDCFMVTCAFKRRCREKENNNPVLHWHIRVSRAYSRDAYDFVEAWRERERDQLVSAI